MDTVYIRRNGNRTEFRLPDSAKWLSAEAFAEWAIWIKQESDMLAHEIESAHEQLKHRFVDMADDDFDTFIGFIVGGYAPERADWQPAADVEDARDTYGYTANGERIQA